MSQATVINPNQPSVNQTQRGSEMMKYYLVTNPSTPTERLVQGYVMSDQEIEDSMKHKKSQLDALVKQAMGRSS